MEKYLFFSKIFATVDYFRLSACVATFAAMGIAQYTTQQTKHTEDKTE